MDWDKLSLILQKGNMEQFTEDDYKLLTTNQIIQQKSEDGISDSLDLIKQQVVIKMQQHLDYMKNKIILQETIKKMSLDNITLSDNKKLNNIASQIPVENLPSKYKTLLYDNCTKIVYNKLEKTQKLIFNKIHQALSSSLSNNQSNTVIDPKVLLLDAQPGVGKSYLISILGHTLNFENVTAMANSNVLANSLNIPNVIKGLTNTKFIMDTFKLSFEEANLIFKKNNEPQSVILKFIYDYVRKYKIKRTNLLILDEYTLCSPLFISILIVAAKVQRFNLLITGDKDQLDAIDKLSHHHNKDNYELVSKFCNEKYSLTQQMRITDLEHLALVLKIKKYITDRQFHNENIPNNFEFKFLTFELLMPKFFTIDPILDSVYVAQFHVNIKNRILKMQEYMNKNGIQYKKVYFEKKIEGITSKLILPDHEKFLPYILLAVGLTYIMIWPNLKSRKIVKLKSISDTILEVEDISDNKIIYVKKESWTNYCYNCSKQQYEWMLEYVPAKVTEWSNFPLSPYLCTFHSLQGQNISRENFVINMDSTHVNSIYVALSRIKEGSQLKHLCSSDLVSLMYTKYKSDEYYYKIPFIDKDSIKYLLYSITNSNKITFDDSSILKRCKNVSMKTFENKHHYGFKKIYRSHYNDNDNNNNNNSNNNKRPLENVNEYMTSLSSIVMFLTNNHNLFFNKPLSLSKLLTLYSSFIEEKSIKITEKKIKLQIY